MKIKSSGSEETQHNETSLNPPHTFKSWACDLWLFWLIGLVELSQNSLVHHFSLTGWEKQKLSVKKKSESHRIKNKIESA